MRVGRLGWGSAHDNTSRTAERSPVRIRCRPTLGAPIYYRVLVSRRPIDTALADLAADVTYADALRGTFRLHA
ncbi:hypothetical protein [Embleya sp. NBC_00896]|uniref:hypothetical protein n=1 Tax=Embleya sp. NBC_00896 TaxID=2975961 RepID=UPI0038701E29|nr:hypothetical protein OG928_15750 [Embleya sp. NBC_00896]